MTAAGVENIFLRFVLPQSGQTTVVVSRVDLTKISMTLPHFRHLYSYMGIFLFSAGHFCPTLGTRNLETGGADLMGNASSAIRAKTFAAGPQTCSSHAAVAAAKTFPSASLTESSSLSRHLSLLLLIIRFHNIPLFPHQVPGELFHFHGFPECELLVRFHIFQGNRMSPDHDGQAVISCR